MGREGESRTGWGREFQSRGAVREKALSTKVLSLDRRTVRVRVEEDLRVRDLVATCSYYSLYVWSCCSCGYVQLLHLYAYWRHRTQAVNVNFFNCYLIFLLI